MTITIELAGEPKGKGRVRHTRSGIAFTPASTRSYETALRWAAEVAMKGKKPLTGPLSLVVEAFLPVPRSWSQKKQRMAIAGLVRPIRPPDLNNIIKSTDALNAITWCDDTQVVDVRASKRYSDRPRLVLTVMSLDRDTVVEVVAA